MATVQEAIAHLRSRRPIIRPNVGFSEQLGIYEHAGYDVKEDDVRYKEWKLRRDEEFETKLSNLHL